MTCVCVRARASLCLSLSRILSPPPSLTLALSDSCPLSDFRSWCVCVGPSLSPSLPPSLSPSLRVKGDYGYMQVLGAPLVVYSEVVVCVCVCLSVCLCLSICLSVCLSVCMYVCM